MIGTPIRKGISGGQKRRVSVASQLITCPKILFLDEPTSGLDSRASFEVMNYAKQLAQNSNVSPSPFKSMLFGRLMCSAQIIIIASIHQPSTTTFELFDKLLLLSGGKTCYFGQTPNIQSYFQGIGYPIPSHTNPAEFLLDIVSADFGRDKETGKGQVQDIQNAWTKSTNAAAVMRQVSDTAELTTEKGKRLSLDQLHRPNILTITLAILHRLFIKSYRDVVVYGIRIAMYLGKPSPSTTDPG